MIAGIRHLIVMGRNLPTPVVQSKISLNVSFQRQGTHTFDSLLSFTVSVVQRKVSKFSSHSNRLTTDKASAKEVCRTRGELNFADRH